MCFLFPVFGLTGRGVASGPTVRLKPMSLGGEGNEIERRDNGSDATGLHFIDASKSGGPGNPPGGAVEETLGNKLYYASIMWLQFFRRLKLPRNFNNALVGKIDTNIFDVSFPKHKLFKNHGAERLKSHWRFAFAQMTCNPRLCLPAVCTNDADDRLILQDIFAFEQLFLAGFFLFGFYFFLHTHLLMSFQGVELHLTESLYTGRTHGAVGDKIMRAISRSFVNAS